MPNRNHLSPPIFPQSWASDWGEDCYGLWMSLNYKGIICVFRWMQPGSFIMGSPIDEKGRNNNEQPHNVTLSQGFWMAETTVTQALWQAVMGDNPSKFQKGQFQKGETDNHPVEQVNWEDAHHFIDKLNALHPALRVQLPSEAQWEYACRAGTATAFNFEGDISLKHVNYCGVWDWNTSDDWGDDAIKQTTAVKSYPCNQWGLFEMHGNVWEWCEDWYQADLGKNAVTDPLGADTGDFRVLRGGSWIGSGRYCRSARRRRRTPSRRNGSIGFRLSLGHGAKDRTVEP